MLKFSIVTSGSFDFKKMVKELDAYLAVIDGEEHSFYHQYNQITNINYAMVVYENDAPIGCGAIKEFDLTAMEVKRMYVQAGKRGKGVASQLLHELEKWAAELGYQKCVLETGKRQQDAIALYLKAGYQVIENYGQYVGVENSVCFEKML